MSAPLPPPEFIEDAIIVASLSHACAKTPKQRRVAMERLLALKAERDRLKGKAA